MRDAERQAKEVATTCRCLMARRRAREITRAYDRALRDSGLRITQFTVLAAVILGGADHSLTELAERLGMERSTLSRNLQLLEANAMVRLSPETDRRVRTVQITAAGRRAFQRAVPAWKDAQKHAAL